MSLDAFTFVLRHSQARGTDRLVLLALCDWIDTDDWVGFPSTSTLAGFSQLDPRSARRALDNLERQGRLTEVEMPDRGRYIRADRRPKAYRMITDAEADSPRNDAWRGGTQRHPVGKSRGDNGAERGDTDASHGGTTDTPDPNTDPVTHPRGATRSDDEPITATAPTPEQIARTAELAAQARQALRERRPEVLRGDSAERDPEAVTGDPRPPDAAERALPPSDR